MKWLRLTLGLLLLFPLCVAAQPVALDDYVRMRRSLEAARDDAARAPGPRRALREFCRSVPLRPVP